MILPPIRHHKIQRSTGLSIGWCGICGATDSDPFLVHSSWFVLKLLTIHAIGGWISMKSVSGAKKIPNKNAQNIVFCPFLGAFTLKHLQMF